MNLIFKNYLSRASSFMIALLFVSGFAGNQSLSGQNSASYKNFPELESSLKALVKSSDKAELSSIGKSGEGRDLWLVTLAGKSGIPVSQRPGLLVTANLEGDHLVGSELAIKSIEYLLANYDSNEAVKKAMDEHVFYFLPRINPDGAEKNLSGLKSGVKTNKTPYDGDNDGRLDEDGPEDLNGDGIITVMRVKDPHGIYMIDPEHTELMKKADPSKGERGEYSIYLEGIDNDGDGFINEDPQGGVDINRNFMHAYPYYKEDAGIHMVSEKETRAVLDWVLANPNIAIMLSFGESDNLISAPDSRGELSSENAVSLLDYANQSIAGASKVGMISAGGGFGRGFGGMQFFRGSRGGGAPEASSGRSSRPAREAAKTVDRADQEFFSLFSKKYREITGIETQPPLRKPEGSFFEYGYYQYGVPSMSTPGWGMEIPKDTAAEDPGDRRPAGRRGGASMRGGPGMAGMAGPGAGGGNGGGGGADAKALEWMKKNQVAGFVEWTKVDHPEFQEVEVGGFNTLAITNPPVEMLKDLGEKHAEFMIYLSSLYARVNIAQTEVVNHGGGIFRIKAEVENSGFLPTAIEQGVVSRAVKPTMVQLGIDPSAILSGNNKTNFIQKLDGSGKREKFEWLVKGKSGDKIELKVVSQKGGSDSQIIVLK